MSSITNEDVRQLDKSQPAGFLSLAPTTSDSYPTTQKTTAAAQDPQMRRSSSSGSEGKDGAQLKCRE